MSSIPTSRHLEYARGYIDLGMVNDASDELEAIEGDDRLSPDVLRVRIDLYFEAKQWDMVVAVAKPVCEAMPQDSDAWINYAFALRELQRITEARDVLLIAEPLHGTSCAVLHYNLACYYCLLGDMPEAKRRLSVACKAADTWKTAALDDPDLKAMWHDIAAMP